MMNTLVAVVVTFISLGVVFCQNDPHFVANRTTIVHLFEWGWNDIAKECEQFLGPFGYGGVQVSPPNENVIAASGEIQRPWWERYQPVSYKLETRSGTEKQFKAMVKKCNSVGVRIYIDAVINHMTGDWGVGYGTGGSYFDASSLNYSAVPYSKEDFNTGYCNNGNIQNYQDTDQVRNCKLQGLHDLNQGKKHVRERISAYFNKLVSYGVAGFRIDASKHMWPGDIKAILDQVNSLSTAHGFPSGARPFVFQEVIDLGNEGIKAQDYFGNGRVTEFKICANIGNIFRKWNQQLRWLKNWGEGWSFLPSVNALVFVDNHDNQRGHGAGGESILTFRVARLYKMAQAFTLAWPYGVTRVMSSYNWEQKLVEGKDKNDWIGPPHDDKFKILPVTIKSDMTCENGWICEHRWRQIFNMVGFRNHVQGTIVEGWWDNQKDQIAFSRGNRGFIAINNDDHMLDASIPTTLPPGDYCDLISGRIVGGKCTGKIITVGSDNKVNIKISNTDEDPMVAITTEMKL
ncbi:unnamed protein product [Allacma fusca]|uniref:Alpha-amylase n=1 Tax=Allacma fusca TaxID=39272 RepID=A0A8J2P512_9HEXA|nr:unnamed protein product [Allacma fusca]